MSSKNEPLTTLSLSRQFLLLQLRSWFVVLLFISFFFLPLWFCFLLFVFMLFYDIFCRNVFIRLYQHFIPLD